MHIYPSSFLFCFHTFHLIKCLEKFPLNHIIHSCLDLSGKAIWVVVVINSIKSW